MNSSLSRSADLMETESPPNPARLNTNSSKTSDKGQAKVRVTLQKVRV